MLFLILFLHIVLMCKYYFKNNAVIIMTKGSDLLKFHVFTDGPNNRYSRFVIQMCFVLELKLILKIAYFTFFFFVEKIVFF